jgi:hypothetical protein
MKVTLISNVYFLGCETLKAEEATRYFPWSPLIGSKSNE